jgi:outer membrane translocation and assembly module TamA
VELALFADAGRVAPRVEELFERLEADLGVGFRFKSSLDTYFRLDLAKSREGWHTLVRFNQGF